MQPRSLDLSTFCMLPRPTDVLCMYTLSTQQEAADRSSFGIEAEKVEAEILGAEKMSSSSQRLGPGGVAQTPERVISYETSDRPWHRGR
jgi:hypothetical protein